MRVAVKGRWKRLKNKFTTEYTNDYRLKIHLVQAYVISMVIFLIMQKNLHNI